MKTVSNANILNDLDFRARDIFSRIVETYIETGEPVGSVSYTHLDVYKRQPYFSMPDLTT